MDNEISLEDFTTILNEEKKYENYKKALDWLIEVMLKKLAGLKKAKEQVLMKLLSVIKLLITV